MKGEPRYLSIKPTLIAAWRQLFEDVGVLAALLMAARGFAPLLS